MPASGIPGAPTGPPFCSTSTLSGVTSSSGSSMRAVRSFDRAEDDGPAAVLSAGRATPPSA